MCAAHAHSHTVRVDSLVVSSAGEAKKRTSTVDKKLLSAMRAAMRSTPRPLSLSDRRVAQMVRGIMSNRHPPNRAYTIQILRPHLSQLAKIPPLGWQVSFVPEERLRDGTKVRVWFNATRDRRGDAYRGVVVASTRVSMVDSTMLERVAVWSPYHVARCESALTQAEGPPTMEAGDGTVDATHSSQPRQLEKIVYKITWDRVEQGTTTFDMSQADVDVTYVPPQVSKSRVHNTRLSQSLATAPSTSRRRTST